MIPVLYIGGRAYLADLFTVRSKINDTKIDLMLKDYKDVNISASQAVGFQATKTLSDVNRQLSTSILKDTMDLIFLSKYGLDMNPDDTFLNGYLSSGISYLRFLPEENQRFVMGYYAPYPTYKEPESYAREYRSPPLSTLTIPTETDFTTMLEISQLYCETRMNVVNMPLDPLAMRGVGSIAANALNLMLSEREMNRQDETETITQTDKTQFSKTLAPWYEWMKYTYRLALKMRGRDSKDWYCIDIEFMKALLQTEGSEEDFQEEFIKRLKHREKLIEYGIDKDLPGLWYAFYENNYPLLETEKKEEAMALMLKIQRMVNEGQNDELKPD